MPWVRPSEDAPPRELSAHELGELGEARADQAAAPRGGVLRPDTLVSVDEAGPFAPLVAATTRDGRLRDAFARMVPLPSVRAFARVRLVLLAIALVPGLMLVELDRELLAARVASFAPLALDVLVLGFVTWELTRSTPRLPGVAGAAAAATALRWALVATRSCGKAVHPLVWAACALAALAAGGILTQAPSRARVVLELLDRLGISPSEASAARGEARVGDRGALFALLAAAGLPACLFALRRGGVDLWTQGAVFVMYALFVPELLRRTRQLAPLGEGRRRRLGEIALGVFAGLALTTALVQGARHFFDTGHELARCVGRLDDETKRLLAREALETSSGVAKVRASSALALMTVLFIPVAEERIYRGLLMDALVKRYGAAYGLFASAVVFGIAHLGVYEVALYQTVLLGLAFGVAYAEGGIVASILVHATWNLLLLVR